MHLDKIASITAYAEGVEGRSYFYRRGGVTSPVLLSEPGFSGLQDLQDWELVIMYSVVKDERLPFAKGHWHISLLSWESCNPVNPGSDKCLWAILNKNVTIFSDI